MAQPSTQKYLDIAEIKENVVVLKNGTLRSVIICSSINFALKSEDEQNALISGYMQFLNALDHPLQIVIQSRKLDVDGYMRKLAESQKKQTNELLKVQVGSYLEFIKELIEIGEIMTKRFLIVVPYDPLGDKARGFWPRLKEVLRPGQLIKIKKDKFSEYKVKLNLRLSNIQSNLQGMGLETAPLDTQSLIELYYNVYNPKTSQNQKLRDVSKLNIEA
jgi:hypothetical protein